jgi:hypothetical protein
MDKDPKENAGRNSKRGFRPKNREIFILDVRSGKRAYNYVCVLDQSGNGVGGMKSVACQALLDGISTVWCRAHSKEEAVKDLKAVAETVIRTRIHRRRPDCPDIAGSRFFMN